MNLRRAPNQVQKMAGVLAAQKWEVRVNDRRVQWPEGVYRRIFGAMDDYHAVVSASGADAAVQAFTTKKNLNPFYFYANRVGEDPETAKRNWRYAGEGNSSQQEIPVSNLRRATIKLANEHPELRKHLVPILQRTARVLSKLESQGKLRDLAKKHGERTKAYYAAVLKEVKGGVIAPSAVVGGGYKNGKKVAIKWLEEQMSKAK